MGITDDFVFKENNDNVKGSPRATDQLLHQLSNINSRAPNSQTDTLKRLKNQSLMKMINNGLHMDQK